MAETQRSLGGAGQRVAGASAHTLVIWDHIHEHPGLTVDQLKAKAIALDWIPRGYAHRFYAGKNNHRRSKSNGRALTPSVAEIAATRSDDAVRAVVTQALAMMRRDGTVRRDDLGGYHAIRRPRAAAQVQARVRPRNEVMAGIALAEVRRQLLAFGIDRLEQSHARVPLEVRQLLAKWLRASQMVEEVAGSEVHDGAQQAVEVAEGVGRQPFAEADELGEAVVGVVGGLGFGDA